MHELFTTEAVVHGVKINSLPPLLFCVILNCKSVLVTRGGYIDVL